MIRELPAPQESDRFRVANWKGMPANLEAERLILGSILLDDARFIAVAAGLEVEDFAIERHRIIFRLMCEMNMRGERLDRVTVANELGRRGELENTGGLSYLVSLDDGMPVISNLTSYVGIVKAKALLRRAAVTGQQLMNRALLAEDDPALIIAETNAQLLSLTTQDNREGPVTVREIMDDYAGGINNLLDPSKQPQGVPSGFTRFDEMTGGLRGGEMIVIAGRPSMGKTAIAMNIAENVAVKQEKRVAVFSLEMSRENLLRRSLCSIGRVDGQRFRGGFCNAEERAKLRAAAIKLYEAPLHIDDKATLGVIDIFARCQRIIAEFGALSLVVVDYLQLMSPPRGKGARSDGRVNDVSAMSRQTKVMAKELGVPVIVLSQLSRNPEGRPDKRPVLADLRESGAIEQDADLVGFVFREEVYKPDREDLRGVAELILAKQRNGPTGVVNLVWMRAMTKFENRAEDMGWSPDPPPGVNYTEPRTDQ